MTSIKYLSVSVITGLLGTMAFAETYLELVRSKIDIPLSKSETVTLTANRASLSRLCIGESVLAQKIDFINRVQFALFDPATQSEIVSAAKEQATRTVNTFNLMTSGHSEFCESLELSTTLIAIEFEERNPRLFE